MTLAIPGSSRFPRMFRRRFNRQLWPRSLTDITVSGRAPVRLGPLYMSPVYNRGRSAFRLPSRLRALVGQIASTAPLRQPRSSRPRTSPGTRRKRGARPVDHCVHGPPPECTHFIPVCAGRPILRKQARRMSNETWSKWQANTGAVLQWGGGRLFRRTCRGPVRRRFARVGSGCPGSNCHGVGSCGRDPDIDAMSSSCEARTV